MQSEFLICFILAYLVLSCSASEGKRKKMRRKVIVNTSTAAPSTTTPVSQVTENVADFKGNDKVPRGFLDDYYAQFENRLSKGSDDKMMKLHKERLSRPFPTINRLEMIPEKYLEYINSADKREKSQRISYENGQIGGGMIPSHSIYSSYPQPHGPSQDSKTQLKGNKNPLNNFFGISGLSSQSIQLGLTFTVPFLSFPLSAISSILNGVGSNNLFDFDTQSLMIGAVMVAGALFVLPQLIYWLTGVNLSAFTWGRNDDSGNISSLINTVDEALYRYDVDTRSCVAKTLCKRMRSRDEGFMTGLIGKFMGSELFQNIMGKDRVKNLSENQCPESSSNCPWDVGPLTKFTMDLLQKKSGDILSMAARKFLEDDDGDSF